MAGVAEYCVLVYLLWLENEVCEGETSLAVNPGTEVCGIDEILWVYHEVTVVQNVV
jgi:hypothetical protein